MKLHFLLLALLAVQPFIADTNTFFPKNLYKSPPRRLETTASSSNSTNSTNSTSSTNSTNSTNPTQPVILPNGTVYEAGDPLRFVLLYATFYGEWTGTEGVASQGNYFVQKSGYVVLEPSHEDDIDDTDTPTDTDGSWDGFTDSTDGTDLSESDENYSDTDFELIIFDGDAINRNSIQLFVNMAYNKFVYNSSNSSFSGTQMITYTTNGQNANKISNCSADVSVYFLNMSNNKSPALSDPHVPLNSLGIQFQVTNSNCSISFTTNVMTIVSFIDTALPVYIVLISIAGIISVYSTYHMVKNFPANVEELKSMSVWSLWITSAWELFLAVFHVYVAIKYFRFYILIVSFIFLFTISMLRKINELILIVSRVERGDILPLNSRVLMSLIPMCLLCATYCVGAFVPVTSFFLLTGSLYMVPQIYRIWKRGERPSGYYLHNFAFAFSKIFFVAYYLLYTDNLFEAPQNVPIACTFIGLIFVQMVIVLIQRHLPQCLFTWRKYIKKPSVTAGGNEDCCICFEALAPNDLASSVQKMHDQIVQTPCDHKFHRRCIEEWVNLRGSCPLDRNKLKLEDLLF